MSTRKILDEILRGASDANIRFTDLTNLLLAFGFEKRTKGSHQIFFKTGIAEILNLQPLGSKAKPYQVKQVRNVILKYKLGDAPDA
jgi:hypothetical protein